ncbi:MAG: DUF559 domain-containing protein [Hyphomonadaceae bacterium]|nr:DUF559 domain-containing protein [Hyphomonadaceae bacterium]
MRKQPSQAEHIVWELVRGRQLGAKFRRQHPIDNYIADFACIDAKLIVEIDGRSHDTEEQRLWDDQRARRLNELGWRLFVVRDDDILRDAPAVVERITSELRATPSPCPLPLAGKRGLRS